MVAGELLRAAAASTSSLAFRWSRLQVHVEGDAAWVNAVGHRTVARADEPPRTSPYRLTAVFVRRAGRWLWHTFSGSEPEPVADGHAAE